LATRDLALEHRHYSVDDRLWYRDGAAHCCRLIVVAVVGELVQRWEQLLQDVALEGVDQHQRLRADRAGEVLVQAVAVSMEH